MLDLADDRGTVEVDKRADLVVLSADPLAGPRAFREVAWTIQGGVARTPEEWMAAE
jgi:imidazolonepropionase-like amidohydrolase